MNRAISLLKLPVELLSTTASYLGKLDIIALSSACKLLRTLLLPKLFLNLYFSTDEDVDRFIDYTKAAVNSSNIRKYTQDVYINQPHLFPPVGEEMAYVNKILASVWFENLKTLRLVTFSDAVLSDVGAHLFRFSKLETLTIYELRRTVMHEDLVDAIDWDIGNFYRGLEQLQNLRCFQLSKVSIRNGADWSIMVGEILQHLLVCHSLEKLQVHTLFPNAVESLGNLVRQRRLKSVSIGITPGNEIRLQTMITGIAESLRHAPVLQELIISISDDTCLDATAFQALVNSILPREERTLNLKIFKLEANIECNEEFFIAFELLSGVYVEQIILEVIMPLDSRRSVESVTAVLKNPSLTYFSQIQLFPEFLDPFLDEINSNPKIKELAIDISMLTNINRFCQIFTNYNGLKVLTLGFSHKTDFAELNRTIPQHSSLEVLVLYTSCARSEDFCAVCDFQSQQIVSLILAVCKSKSRICDLTHPYFVGQEFYYVLMQRLGRELTEGEVVVGSAYIRIIIPQKRNLEILFGDEVSDAELKKAYKLGFDSRNE
ncbi:hypothetical protein HK098_005463 [Nowakowskiella sp. JEL0407]|nr:hypothetical protein HK098_005463 [Nowakowskiella sp. JEL0407]